MMAVLMCTNILQFTVKITKTSKLDLNHVKINGREIIYVADTEHWHCYLSIDITKKMLSRKADQLNLELSLWL